MQRSPIPSSPKEKHRREPPRVWPRMLKEVVHCGAQKLVTMFGLERKRGSRETQRETEWGGERREGGAGET